MNGVVRVEQAEHAGARRRGYTESLLGASSLALCLLLASSAGAQRRTPPPSTTTSSSADTTDRARELFERGLASLEAERWEEARGLFEQAWALAPRPSILVNLGTAQRQSGHLVEAVESYRTFLERFPDHELAARTRTTLTEVEALLPHLTIQVEGMHEGDEVFLDEDPVPALGSAFPANPGLRQVSLWRDGRMLQSVRVRVELEGNEEVFLRATDLAPSAVAAASTTGDGASAATETGPAASSGGDDTPLVVGLVIGAVVLVGAGVALGVVFGTQDSARPVVDPTIRAGVLTFQ